MPTSNAAILTPTISNASGTVLSDPDTVGYVEWLEGSIFGPADIDTYSGATLEVSFGGAISFLVTPTDGSNMEIWQQVGRGGNLYIVGHDSNFNLTAATFTTAPRKRM